MSTIKLRIIVADLEEVLALYNRIKVYRSISGPTGEYVELTNEFTRIPLVAEDTLYEYEDLVGAPSYYYKTVYFHSVTLAESEPSPAVKGQGTGNYVSIQDLRDEGITEVMLSDNRALVLIHLYEHYVEKVTGQWFYPRDMTLKMDGTGSNLLLLPVPIVRITELKVNNETVAVPATDYVAYDEFIPDDRQNPMIKLKNRIFNRGPRNQTIVGTFGYTEDDGSAPELIKYAARKLIAKNLTLLGQGGSSTLAGPVVEEWSDRHRIRYSEKTIASADSAGGGVSATGDPELDMIFSQFRRPMAIDAPWGELLEGTEDERDTEDYREY